MAADDVVAALAKVVTGKPVNDIVEVAGPDKVPMAEIVQRALVAKHDPRKVLSDSNAGYFGYQIDDHSLTPGDPTTQIGPTRFEDWLSKTA